MTTEVKDPPITPNPPIVPEDKGSSAAEGALGAGTDGGKGEEDQWFVPGKYKTQEDALKDYDKRIGGLAQGMDDVKKLLSKPATASTTTGAPSGSQVNPATGQPWTEDQVIEQWNNWFQTNPTEAALALSDLLGRQNEGQIVNKVRAALTWDTFIAANPEMASEENRKLLAEVLTSFPVIARKSDCLIKAKEIVLSSGADVEEKYENWLHSRKNGKGKPPKEEPPAMPGQGGTGKGGKALPDDPFFKNKDGSSIFG